ncbi:alpha/beta hydrolase [Aggregatimonas sangjinii]|uniref:Alpha/beta hydrolase n=1 Tax=Aggregatimonas sangjinii TaxID=2583587 RepID=A0A5B7SP49_9FLAO|nr:alpha/beta hydrolase [Aggregatimonas sangjinii]QCW99941.1 alpha/beta hydrolase [Aggregatimonas sangjinii]
MEEKLSFYKLFIVRLVFLIFTVLLLGCYSYNRPLSSPTTSIATVGITKVFVDVNGDYYPNNWQSQIKPNKIKSSLFLAYSNVDKEEILYRFRDDFLADFREKVKSKDRIYILVHGYNNNEIQAKRAFSKLIKKINIDPINDEVVEFYWDGLIGKGIGSAKIWSNAAGYSQMSGVLGLRPILNQLNNKEIFLISHSRGASVILSAISDPSWDKNFYIKTAGSLRERFLKPKGLLKNDNTIKSIMLAPAIGNVDFFKFRRKDDYILNHDNYRLFDSQFSEVYYTVNKHDVILKKIFKSLTNKLNPTGIGYDGSEVGVLMEIYDSPKFKKYDFSAGNHAHDFLDYVGNSKLNEILIDAEVPIKSN